MKTFVRTAFLILFSAALFFVSCRKDRFTTSSSDKLSFSNDTILFDTVFATIGSTTQYFKVYNPHDEKIKISQIRLAGGTNSQFRINVDGDNGAAFSDIEILPKDSIFLFAEVTIDPGNSNLPFVVEDSILFETNGNLQKVHLVAWGQNAHFHGGLNAITVLPPGEVWNNDLPHVIYGVVAVDSLEQLIINAGTQVYCHKNSGLLVYKSKLVVNGELNNEVVFQGDRLEASYRDVPGQWGIQLSFNFQASYGLDIGTVSRGGIWLVQSTGSLINYGIIKNGGIGIQVDTTGVSYGGSVPAVEMRNTRIENMSGVGLLGLGGYIKGTNVLVSDCAEGCANLGIGGRYEMDNCTFADYWTSGTRQTPTFVLNNYYEDVNQNIQLRDLINCRFRNCIMYGNNALLQDFNEFVIDTREGSVLNYQFKSCLVDAGIDVSDDGNFFQDMVNGQAPYFCDPTNSNFKISQSDSRMFGGNYFTGPDLLQFSNPNQPYWKGCYDYNPDPQQTCALE